MIPASFAKMILKLLFPKLEKMFDKVKLEIIEHIYKVCKVKENNDYRELPNDCDIKVEKLEEQMKMVVKDLHPPAIDLKEYEQMKADLTTIRNMKVFKKLGK